MIPFMKKLAVLLSVLVFSACETKFPVSFHMQAAEGQQGKFVIERGNMIYDRVPFVTQSDFENYRSFPADDGRTYGVVFQSKAMIRPRIEAYTANNLGSYILPVVNGHPMELLKLNNMPIRTGQLVVWSGFTEADLATLSEVVPPTPEEAKKDMKAFREKGQRNLSAKKEAEEAEEKESSEKTDSQGRKILSTRRGRF